VNVHLNVYTTAQPRAMQARVRRLATEQRLSAMDIATDLRLDLTMVCTLFAGTKQIELDRGAP
jgi:hypothetical protein